MCTFYWVGLDIVKEVSMTNSKPKEFTRIKRTLKKLNLQAEEKQKDHKLP